MPPKQPSVSREELLNRLKEKRAGLRQPKIQVSEKDYKQAMSSLTNEMKKVNEDSRITLQMKDLYQKTIVAYDKIKIPSPVELLNNVDTATKQFEQHINGMLAKCKHDKVSKEKFVDEYLNSLYTQYYISVLGLNVVPEKLRNLIKTN